MAKKQAEYDGYVCTDSVKIKDLADVRPDEKGAEDRRATTAKRPKR